MTSKALHPLTIEVQQHLPDEGLGDGVVGDGAGEPGVEVLGREAGEEHPRRQDPVPRGLRGPPHRLAPPAPHDAGLGVAWGRGEGGLDTELRGFVSAEAETKE